jgi:hypothetical protein
MLSSCTPSNEDIVKKYTAAVNSLDYENAESFLDDNFKYVDIGRTLNKQEFLARLDSSKYLEFKHSIISLKNYDSLVIVEERNASIIDSILEVTPKMIQRKTYRFSNGKISSINRDSLLNFFEYTAAFNDKYSQFTFFVQDLYEIQDQSDLRNSMKKYLIEYNKISPIEKKRYRTYARLQGTYTSEDNTFYRKLIFKGKTTVVIVDAIFNMSFPSSYVIDEDYIRIRTDKSDLLFRIKDSKTIIGEGFASGTYIKTD